MYADDMLFVENDFGRFSIGSTTDGLKRNPDGSLTITIQKESPGRYFQLVTRAGRTVQSDHAALWPRYFRARRLLPAAGCEADPTAKEQQS
jgi:hypothetical protein